MWGRGGLKANLPLQPGSKAPLGSEAKFGFPQRLTLRFGISNAEGAGLDTQILGKAFSSLLTNFSEPNPPNSDARSSHGDLIETPQAYAVVVIVL
jgi:hypothetical protein